MDILDRSIPGPDEGTPKSSFPTEDPFPSLDFRAHSIGSLPTAPFAMTMCETVAAPHVAPGPGWELPRPEAKEAKPAQDDANMSAEPSAKKTSRRKPRVEPKTKKMKKAEQDSSSDEAELKKKRLQRNRESARESRRRKKNYIKTLESKVPHPITSSFRFKSCNKRSITTRAS